MHADLWMLEDSAAVGFIAPGGKFLFSFDFSARHSLDSSGFAAVDSLRSPSLHVSTSFSSPDINQRAVRECAADEEKLPLRCLTREGHPEARVKISGKEDLTRTNDCMWRKNSESHLICNKPVFPS